MKKRVSILLIALLVLNLMVGCTKQESPAAPVETPQENPQTTPSEPVAKIDYPTKPVQLMVPWSPGGATDVIFRLVAEYAQVELGKPIVILNQAGAGGTVGATQVKDAANDGYTILGGHDHLITSYIEGIADFTYDAFETVSLLTTTPNLMVVNSKATWNSPTEFIADAKANPGKYSWAASLGSTSHYFALGILNAGGLTTDDVRIVGTPGTNESITAVLGNHVNVCQAQISTAGSYIESGDLKFLAVAHEERLSQAPDVPTLRELGLNYVQGTNRGIFVPKGTDPQIIEILDNAFRSAMENPELIEKIENLGNNVNYKNPSDYYDFMVEQFEEMEKISATISN